MKKILILLIIFLIPLVYATEDYYKLGLSLNNFTLKFESLEVIPTFLNYSNIGNEYIIKIYSTERLLFTNSFSISQEKLVDNYNYEEKRMIRYIDSSNPFDYIYLPYYSNATEIKIYDSSNNLKLIVPLFKWNKEETEINVPTININETSNSSLSLATNDKYKIYLFLMIGILVVILFLLVIWKIKFKK